MPIKRALTPDELNAMEKAGYDTSSYKGEAIEIPDPPEQTSKTEAAVRGVLSNLLPATAGAGGFAGGATLGAGAGAFGGPAAPITIPLGWLVGGLAGGAAASAGTKKVQDMLTPEATLARNSLAAQEHPYITKGADLAAMAATMAPNPMNLVRAGGGLVQALAPAAGKTVINTAGRDALKLVAGGAGIGAAGEIGNQLVAGDGLHIAPIAEAAATGALFNQPTALGHLVMRSSPAAERIVDNHDMLRATLGNLPNLKEATDGIAEETKQQKQVNRTIKEGIKAKKAAAEAADLKKALESPTFEIPKKEEATKPKDAVVKPTPPSETAPLVTPPSPPAVAPTPLVATDASKPETVPVLPAPTTTPVEAKPVVVPQEVARPSVASTAPELAQDEAVRKSTSIEVTDEFYKNTGIDADSHKAVPLLVKFLEKAGPKREELVKAIADKEAELKAHQAEINAKPDDYFALRHGEQKANMDFLFENDAQKRSLNKQLNDLDSNIKISGDYLNYHQEKINNSPKPVKEPTLSNELADQLWDERTIERPGESLPWTSKKEMQADLSKLHKTFDESNSTSMFHDQTGLSKPQLAFLRSAGIIDAQLNSPPFQVIMLAKAKTKSVPKKQSKEEFYSGKRKEHAKAIAEIADAWQEEADSGKSGPLAAVVGSYGGDGVDINHIGNLQPHSNEFVDAVMKLRGDKSKPGKAAPKAKPVEAPKPVAETLEQRNARLTAEQTDQPLNQPNENIQTALGSEVSDAIGKLGKATAPTTAYKAAVEQVNAGGRKLATTEDPSLPHKGQFDTKNPGIKVNPTTETLDTRPHEGAHDMVRMIYEAKAKGSTRATDYINKLESAQKDALDAYNKDRSKKNLPPVDHEEFATSQQGFEFLKQQLNLNKETKWKKWWNDTKALYSTAYGKNPSIEDLRRVLNFRYVHENVSGRPEVKSPAPLVLPDKKEVITDGKKNEKQKEQVLNKEEQLPLQEAALPFKDGKDRQVQFEAVKDKAGAEDIMKKLDSEKKILMKKYTENLADEGVRHDAVNSMQVNKMLTHILEKEHGVKSDPTIKFQDMLDGLSRTELNQPANAGLPRTETPTDVLPPDPTRQSFIHSMAATFDRVGEISQPIAQAARDYENRKSGYQGMANAAMVDLSKFNRDDVNRVMAEHRNAYRNDAMPILDGPHDTEISKILSDYYGKIADIRRDIGIKINERTAGKNEYYVPDMMNAETIHEFTHNPLGDKATALKEEWADHVQNEEGPDSTHTREEILSDINRYIEALGGKDNNYKSLEFGAIRKAAGYGLPESMRDADATSTLARYSRRAASDLAFFQEIQNKPEIAGPLHIKDQNGDVIAGHSNSAFPQDTRIRNMMKWVTGDIGGASKQSPTFRSAVRLINNALLGPATGIRDLVSVPMNALPYIHQFSDLAAAWKGMMNVRENSRAALETGARQPQIDKVAFNDVLGAPDRLATVVGKVADGLRKWQGREAIENLSRDVTFSMGKELGRNNIIGAKAGNEKSIQWLKKFGDLVEGDILTKEGPELEKALDQIGKNFTDRNQGTYGGRGLPAGMVDSQFAPFFSLQKWSVEKANVIYKDVYKPFMTGENRLPMLTYTLGSLMTGAAIQQLNQLMSGKKAMDPTIAEALDKGDAASVIQELGTIMQLGSYAGLVSDAVKMAADVGIRGRVPRNIVSFPTATAAVKTEESIADMMEAIRQGEDPWKVLKAFSLDMLTTNIQLARMIANRTVNDENTDRKDKFRDMRVFNELEGKPAGVIAKTNPYLGLDAKEFKRSGSVQEAAKMVPELVRKAVDKSKGNPEVLRQSLGSLKGNSYQTMPSPESSPIEFKKFYDFMVRTQGVDKANERVKDHAMQRLINTTKGQLIP
jgi:hypothetical protein